MWFVLKYIAITYLILTAIRLLLKYFVYGSPDRKNEVNAKGKLVIITGSNAGVGRAAALEFSLRDAIVILACRDISKAASAIDWIRSKTSRGQLLCMKLDLASLDSVRKFAQEFKSKYDRLDILVNNGGVQVPPQKNWKTSDGFEIHMGVNHLAHFLLTNLLLEPLKKAAPSRVIHVSSIGHSRGKLNLNDILSEKEKIAPQTNIFIPNLLYTRSKMAQALFNKELAKRLKSTGIQTYALCPGGVKTEIGRNLEGPLDYLLKPLEFIFFTYFLKTPEQGAGTIMHCALNKSLISETGEMYQNCGFWDPKWRAELKDEDAKKLWEESAKLVGL